MIEIKSDKIITPEGIRAGYLYVENGKIDGFSETRKPAEEH